MEEKVSPENGHTNRLVRNPTAANSPEFSSCTWKQKVQDDLYPSTSLSDSSNHQLFNEASKIFQISMEKDFALAEKEKIIQDAMETIDNLRKNIYQIQMEYEALDQNYQKEVSYREELIKRTDTTRNMIESAAHYSNILATSIKQLEEDKFKIAEFYNEIYRRQEEAEEKRRQMELVLKEQDEIMKSSVVQVAAAKEHLLQEISLLGKTLSETQKKLKDECEENFKLQTKYANLQEDMRLMEIKVNNEQTSRIKYQVAESKLKRILMNERREQIKIKNKQRSFYRRKYKELKRQLELVRRKLTASVKNESAYLVTLNDLNAKCNDHEKEYKKLYDLYITEVNEIKEENIIKCHETKIEIEKEQLKCKELLENHTKLLEEFEKLKSKLEDRDTELHEILKDNSVLKRKMECMERELNEKLQIIKEYEMTIQAGKIDELEQKISDLQKEVEEYDRLKQECQKEMNRMKETAAEESSAKMNIIREQKAQIEKLESDLKVMTDENEVMRNNLRVSSMDVIQIQDELKMKAGEFEKLTSEFEKKMKVISNDEEHIKTLEESLRAKEIINEELTRNVQILQEEKLLLQRDLKQHLDRGITLSTTLNLERNENSQTVRKFEKELAVVRKSLDTEKERFQAAEKEIIELRERLANSMSNEETRIQQKGSFASAEAIVETYKAIDSKSENYPVESTKHNDKSKKSLSKEILGRKKKNGKDEAFDKLLAEANANKEVVVRDIKSVNQESLDFNRCMVSSASTSRRLLSTPKRLLANTLPSPSSKPTSSYKNNVDPYEFDSDSSTERFESNKVITTFRKKEDSSKRRRK